MQNYADYIPARSDVLVHWTGKDIDEPVRRPDGVPPNWVRNEPSKVTPAELSGYLRRLKHTIRFGLWMNQAEEGKEKIEVGGHSVQVPGYARTCFTELKMSQARAHAARYGRLGIGFKRTFLFERAGGPVIYYGARPDWPEMNWLVREAQARGRTVQGSVLGCFLKRMNREQGETGPGYCYYDEAEWRIVRPEDAVRIGMPDATWAHFRRPEDTEGFAEEFPSRDSWPRWLVPVSSRWLCLIIYPSLRTKVAAEHDAEIQELLRGTKTGDFQMVSQAKEPSADLENVSGVIGIDLDMCRNF